MALPEISIIVPVYNAEKYLDQFIRSVLSQDFRNYELILIDDGSTDGSGQLCDRYALEDNRIKVFHKQNGGVSSARNLGIQKSTGEWLYFCDSDDELLPGCLKTLINITDVKIELIDAGFEISDNGKIITHPYHQEQILSRNAYIGNLFDPFDGRYHGYLWTKLFRRDIITQNSIAFDPNIYYNEDRLFIFEYLCKTSGSVYYSSKPVYRYFIRSGGAMQSLHNGKYERFKTDLDAFIKMYALSLPLNNIKLGNTIKYRSFLSYIRNIDLINKYASNPTEETQQLKRTLIKAYGKWAYINYYYKYYKNRVKARFFSLVK